MSEAELISIVAAILQSRIRPWWRLWPSLSAEVAISRAEVLIDASANLASFRENRRWQEERKQNLAAVLPGGIDGIVPGVFVPPIPNLTNIQRPTGEKCDRCDGCGKIANTSGGEPWNAWLELPLRSSSGIVSGIVRPVDCPECAGTGVQKPQHEGRS